MAYSRMHPDRNLQFQFETKCISCSSVIVQASNISVKAVRLSNVTPAFKCCLIVARFFVGLCGLVVVSPTVLLTHCI